MSGDLDYGNIMNRAMRGFIKEVLQRVADNGLPGEHHLSLIHISEPTRLLSISYAVFCLKKKKTTNTKK